MAYHWLNGSPDLNLLEDQYWFHDNLSDEDLKQILTKDGDFLVRKIKKKDPRVSQEAEDEERYVTSIFSTCNGYSDHCFDRGFRCQSSVDVGSLVKDKWNHPQLKTPIIRKQYQLKHEDIILTQDLIGEGQFANVYKATYKPMDSLVAVKIYKDTMTADKKRKFLLEGFILGQNNHPNIVKFIGIAASKHPMMIVTEYLVGGDLLNYLRNTDLLSSDVLISMCKDVASGMAHLERKNCIHRDLAARNCLVDDNHLVKISDFGMSRLENEYCTTGSGPIPLMWTAPEAIRGTYTSKSDVWSFGILMWEVFSKGENPYPNLDPKECTEVKLFQKLESGYRMKVPKGTPKECALLMSNCWVFSTEDRYNFQKVEFELMKIHKDYSKSVWFW